jgi:hypothetical protein
MRPVSKSVSNPKYSPPATFTFVGSTASPIRKVLKRSSVVNVPVTDCLQCWLRHVIGHKSLGGAKAEQLQAVRAIVNKVAASYKCASVPLMDELGEFCSFCETKLPGLLEVEHCVPKSQYPTFALSWNNFLLACSPCNIAKGSDPCRSCVQGWLGGQIKTEQDCYDEIRLRHYVWADIGSQSYRSLPLQMEFCDPIANTWATLPMNQAAHLDNFIVSTNTSKREVKARIHDPADPNLQNYKEGNVRVTIITAGNQSRCDEMVDLCKLNSDGSLNSTFDRRLSNRTKAWFRCLKAMKSYQVSGSSSASWDLVLQNAVSEGFYSVWLTILHWHDKHLARRFVTDTNNPNSFPGTDATNLP